MKRYNYDICKSSLFKIAGSLISAIIFCMPAFSAPAERYASSSVLASGKWMKINISTPGLQTLTRQTLKNFGFSNPKEVYVYGYGGRMISEVLSDSHPDDLPAVPVVRKDDGSITFYAVGFISTTSSSSSEMAYDHTINPYGETSYYFISDVPPKRETESLDLSNTEGMPSVSSSTCQIVHEKDILNCASSGRNYLGEDFKTTKSQNFSFDLPDNAGGGAAIRIQFGANTSGAPSSFIVSANGTRLPATESDIINAVTASDQYYAITTSTKYAEGVGNSLTVGIEYTQGGVAKIARLDWIEVEYERELKIRDSQLLFQVNPKVPTSYSISGATDQTVIWDVTEPWNVKEVTGHYNAGDKSVSIAVKTPGFREFIAFDPAAKGSTITGRIKVANQDIHSLPTPEMVIITPDEFSAAAEKIADIHRTHDGMMVHVLSPEKIFNEFSSGNEDLSAFRKLLKMWYDRSLNDADGRRFGYCLLMGRPTYDQKRKGAETLNSAYPRTLIWQSPTGLSETSSYCTDDFIAMLEDETQDRPMSARKQLIGVGRYPVTSSYEAEIIADKLEAYITQPSYGVWRNNVVVIADDGDSANHLKQAESAMSNLISTPSGQNYSYEKLYLDAFDKKQTGTGSIFPEAREKMLTKWQKEGVVLVNFIGHASAKGWTHEKLLTWSDIINMSNQHLPVLYAATCNFGKWDIEDISGAEVMVSNPAGGAIAVITPSRTVYISQNGTLTNSISKEFFKRDSIGKGQRLGDIVRLGKNFSSSPDFNMLRYHLFGDPALRMPVSECTIEIDSVAGLPTALSQADSPTVMARSSVKISGRVVDSNGSTVDFNGPLQFTLFDAEKSVETHGWGDSGEVSVYQDRSSKLATGSTMVTNGLWNATILMPSEIANNYSPAMISAYAYDPLIRKEANGSTDRLFVYGYDSSIPEDEDGPVIECFGINSYSSSDKQVVYSSPVAMAIFSDESGINLSDAGIGHKMSLTLDSEEVYDDVCHYFIPDPEDATKGSISYPLHDLMPGDHQLTLTVWDNARNSSTATVNFKVGVNMRPEVMDILTIYDRDKDKMNVKVVTDRLLTRLDCKLECFDLAGNKIWSIDRKAYSGNDSSISYEWDLTDSNGHRLPRGIYVIRTSVGSDEGLTTVKSKKIAIPAK